MGKLEQLQNSHSLSNTSLSNTSLPNTSLSNNSPSDNKPKEAKPDKALKESDFLDALSRKSFSGKDYRSEFKSSQKPSSQNANFQNESPQITNPQNVSSDNDRAIVIKTKEQDGAKKAVLEGVEKYNSATFNYNKNIIENNLDKPLKSPLDPDFVLAIAYTESNLKPQSKSGVGAIGLMQLMPATAKEQGVKNILNPLENIAGGIKYLGKLTDMFGGDLDKVAAAYNAGQGAVKKYGGTPPYKETRDYVERVASAREGFALSKVEYKIK